MVVLVKRGDGVAIFFGTACVVQPRPAQHPRRQAECGGSSVEREADGARRDEDAAIVETMFGMRWIDGEVEMGGDESDEKRRCATEPRPTDKSGRKGGGWRGKRKVGGGNCARGWRVDSGG